MDKVGAAVEVKEEKEDGVVCPVVVEAVDLVRPALFFKAFNYSLTYIYMYVHTLKYTLF